MAELDCDFPSIHNLQLETWHYFKISNQQTSKTPNPADSLSICTSVDQKEQRRTRVNMYSIYSYIKS